MKRVLITYILLIIGSIFMYSQTQTTDTTLVSNKQLELKAKDAKTGEGEKSVVIKDEPIDISEVKKLEPFKPNPTKSVIYSAIFPGLGQAYNRKYWKLPIIYGGYLGIVYAVSWNGRYYNDYNKAYRDLVLYDGSTHLGTNWKDFLPSLTEQEIMQNPSMRENYANRLRRRKDSFRRYRDMAIIIGIGLYALCIIDAYVDAQLYDFNMSQDLSLALSPMITPPTPVSKMSFGVQCTIKF